VTCPRSNGHTGAGAPPWRISTRQACASPSGPTAWPARPT
jgi:hypothetical protein